jgi:hypothetical protein
MDETIIQKIDDLQNEFAEQKQKFTEKMKSAFKEYTAEFFKANPSIKCVVWGQYTPYFNDGEECIFSVHEPHFSNATGEEIDNVTFYGGYEGEDDGVWSFSTYDLGRGFDFMSGLDINKGSIINFASLIQSDYMSEIMLQTFGDHCKVIATEDGFEIEEHEHD